MLPCLGRPVFGAYVNMSMGVECHPLLSHYLMCKEATTYHRVFAEGATISIT